MMDGKFVAAYFDDVAALAEKLHRDLGQAIDNPEFWQRVEAMAGVFYCQELATELQFIQRRAQYLAMIARERLEPKP